MRECKVNECDELSVVHIERGGMVSYMRRQQVDKEKTQQSESIYYPNNGDTLKRS